MIAAPAATVQFGGPPGQVASRHSPLKEFTCRQGAAVVSSPARCCAERTYRTRAAFSGFQKSAPVAQPPGTTGTYVWQRRRSASKGHAHQLAALLRPNLTRPAVALPDLGRRGSGAAQVIRGATQLGRRRPGGVHHPHCCSCAYQQGTLRSRRPALALAPRARGAVRTVHLLQRLCARARRMSCESGRGRKMMLGGQGSTRLCAYVQAGRGEVRDAAGWVLHAEPAGRVDQAPVRAQRPGPCAGVAARTRNKLRSIGHAAGARRTRCSSDAGGRCSLLKSPGSTASPCVGKRRASADLSVLVLPPAAAMRKMAGLLLRRTPFQSSAEGICLLCQPTNLVLCGRGPPAAPAPPPSRGHSAPCSVRGPRQRCQQVPRVATAPAPVIAWVLARRGGAAAAGPRQYPLRISTAVYNA